MSDPPSSMSDFEEGTVVDGRYLIESVLDMGDMASVFSARHIHLDEPVALKFLSKPKALNSDFRARFLREAKVTAKLRGRNVVNTTDFGFDTEGRPYLVMELLVGESLRDRLARVGPLPIRDAIDFAIQVCQGLAEAHRHGVVHRDLKPANLFITQDIDGTDLVKIVDFGLSKLRFLADDDMTGEGALIGSPGYMAPEQVGGAELADQRADIWSLGIILYEMLAGVPPFCAKTAGKLIMMVVAATDIKPLREHRPEVVPALEQAVMACLTKDISHRPNNVGALAMALAEAVPEAGLREAAQMAVDIQFKPDPRVQQPPPVRVVEDVVDNSPRSPSLSHSAHERNNSDQPATTQPSTAWWGITVALAVAVAVLVWFALRSL